ncbi:MAG: hypothetical protein IT372_12435 [Polyangiaceae bacterium]|nr:hypothetical protein [Polyangiaceae bacterium]
MNAPPSKAPAALGGPEVEPARTSEPPAVEVRADLDLPGETGRQARVLAIWLVCLALAVALGALVGPHVPVEADGTERARVELARGRSARARVGVIVGLALPALLTLGLRARHRRGGAHARGIVIDVTSDGELRIWGRGYGSRVALEGAAVSERLVDIYAGRLGAWRQRRLRVRSAAPDAQRGHKPRSAPGARAIEIATLAVTTDLEAGLRVEGGEGDCVELRREDFERLRAAILERCGPSCAGAPPPAT